MATIEETKSSLIEKLGNPFLSSEQVKDIEYKLEVLNKQQE